MLSEFSACNLNVLTQNLSGLKGMTKLEHVIDSVSERNLDITFFQQIWLEGNFIKFIK